MELQVLDIPLRALKVSGLDQRENSLIAKVKCLISFATIFSFLVTSVMEMQGTEWSVALIVEEIEASMVAMEGALRWSVLFIFKKKIWGVIEETKTFWNVNEVDPDDETGAGTIIRWLRYGSKIYVTSICVSASLAIILPILFAWKEHLPFLAWFPRNYTYGYEICYVTQIFAIINLASTVVGTDALFGVLCGILIVQFRLLNRKLENTKHVRTNRDFELNLREGVRYHLRLIEFGEALGNIYSALLFVQYMITVAIMCAQLYIISENLSDLPQTTRFLSYAISLTFQMGIYCFLAEAVMEESQNTALAVYSSDWYARDIRQVGLYVQMIMRRASEAVSFNGAGLVLIGRVSWLTVFRMSFKVYTLLTSMK